MGGGSCGAYFFLRVVPALAGAFLAAGFLPAPRLGLLSLASLAGQSMFTQIFQGPRPLSTSTSGAPHVSHTSPVAVSEPR